MCKIFMIIAAIDRFRVIKHPVLAHLVCLECVGLGGSLASFNDDRVRQLEFHSVTG